ncbi:MAG: TetR family transcriptional regulator [Trueperaceae bacterium]
MCSAPLDGSADLTAKARIRTAAIQLFGQAGYARTSVRAIAAQAGVSPALVVHHFGSKEGLKRACDQYVAGELLDTEAAAYDQDLLGTMQRWLAEPAAFAAEFDYLSRMILEGSATGDALFDRLVERTEALLTHGAQAGHMSRFSDVRTTSLLVALLGLAPLLLSRQVGRALDESGLNAAALQKLALPTLELLTYGLYTGPEALEATRAAMESVEP